MSIFYDMATISGLAKNLLRVPMKILCFYGAMGAGKTTLIKAMIRELGGQDAGHSPTFTLVNEYVNKHGGVIAYHFDFYRITSEEEALDLGLEEYFSSGAYIFIEWPEKIPNLLPKDHLVIHLQFIDKTTRRVEYFQG
ncbi:MAG: tRNA (adenosine(37)-N6)-threonylcarbamoyltransferase complex ATPase subunit type 1 TsaE [Bacteroidota bacterium]